MCPFVTTNPFLIALISFIIKFYLLFRIKKINAKEEVEFYKKEINAIILAEIKGEDIDITSDSDTDEDGLEIL